MGALVEVAWPGPHRHLTILAPNRGVAALRPEAELEAE
jgi:hypothetical protein